MDGFLGRGISSSETGGNEEGRDLRIQGGIVKVTAMPSRLVGGKRRGQGSVWALESAGLGSRPVLTLTGCVRVRWVGVGAPGEWGPLRGVDRNTHGVPKRKKGFQVAMRVHHRDSWWMVISLRGE